MPTVPADPTGHVLTAEQVARTVRSRRFRRIFHLHTVGHDELDWWPTPAAGRTLQQLRVIREPGTAAGAHRRRPPSTLVRVLDVRGHGVRHVETEDDFLLLDDDVAIRLVYDDHGRFAVAFTAAATALDRYRFIRDTAWVAGQP